MLTSRYDDESRDAVTTKMCSNEALNDLIEYLIHGFIRIFSTEHWAGLSSHFFHSTQMSLLETIIGTEAASDSLPLFLHRPH